MQSCLSGEQILPRESAVARARHAAGAVIGRAMRALPGAPLCDHDWSLPYGINFGADGSPGSWVSICNRCGRHLRQT